MIKMIFSFWFLVLAFFLSPKKGNQAKSESLFALLHEKLKEQEQ